VELFERIRHDKREEGLSVRSLSRRHAVHRRTAQIVATPRTRDPTSMAVACYRRPNGRVRRVRSSNLAATGKPSFGDKWVTADLEAREGEDFR
jgi:hypothetical protein